MKNNFFFIVQFISVAFEHKSMELVFYYINLKYNKDVRLAFEALRVGFGGIQCHKNFEPNRIAITKGTKICSN